MTTTTYQGTKEEQAIIENVRHSIYQHIQDHYYGQQKLTMPIPGKLKELSTASLAELVEGFQHTGWTQVRILTNPTDGGVIEFIYEAPKKKTIIDNL